MQDERTEGPSLADVMFRCPACGSDHVKIPGAPRALPGLALKASDVGATCAGCGHEGSLEAFTGVAPARARGRHGMRPLARLRALLGGYFWKPCPVCGRMFGGHERDGRGVLMRPGRNSMVTCPRCPGDYLALPDLRDGAVMRVRADLDEHGEVRLSFEEPNPAAGMWAR